MKASKDNLHLSLIKLYQKTTFKKTYRKETLMEYEKILNLKEIYNSKLSKSIKKEVITAIIDNIRPHSDIADTIYCIYLEKQYTYRQLLLSVEDKIAVFILDLAKELIPIQYTRCYLELLDFFFNKKLTTKNRYNKVYYDIYLALLTRYNEELTKAKHISEVRKKARKNRTNYPTKEKLDERIFKARKLDRMQKQINTMRFDAFWSIIPKGCKKHKTSCMNLFIGDEYINSSLNDFKKFIEQVKQDYKDKQISAYRYLKNIDNLHRFTRYVSMTDKERAILSKRWVD